MKGDRLSGGDDERALRKERRRCATVLLVTGRAPRLLPLLKVNRLAHDASSVARVESDHKFGSGNFVSDDDRHFDPVQTLTDHAEHLNALCSSAWWPRIYYEIMSGALVWSDETTSNTPVEVIWALRPIVAYRTSLMMDEPREELKPYWDLGLSLFPKWVGFRPERRQATPKLLQLYRRGDVSLRKCLRDLEQEMDKEDTSPETSPEGEG